MERKRKAERPNSSRGYQGRYLTRRNRTDAKRVYGFCGCHKMARGPLVLQHRFTVRQELGQVYRSIGFLPWRFYVHLYAFRTSFLRVQVKSYYPLCDCGLKTLKTGH